MAGRVSAVGAAAGKRWGTSYRRLIVAVGLPRSTTLRWMSRLAQGEPAIGRRGPAKAPSRDEACLQKEIATLDHGRHRSRGATALWHKWRGWISRRAFAQRLGHARRELDRRRRDGLLRVQWLCAGAVWAMDPGQMGGQLWNLVTDLGSRFRFDLLLAGGGCRPSASPPS